MCYAQNTKKIVLYMCNGRIQVAKILLSESELFTLGHYR